ncbi:DUF2332 domain-containing protein [Phenylobacterium sp.]|jgi:hypothetical protein|uniref:DUF2332 domain-containing protein n=1 Tax=Phenylobacterium sp. TaxID=1871053 RepID=UPI002F3FFDA9
MDEPEIPAVAKALSLQAGICRNMGSPLNGELLDRAAADWLAGGPVKALMAPWADSNLRTQFDAAAPLRLIGSWRELALSGDDPAVSVAYDALDAAAIWAAVRVAMVEHRQRLARFMAHEPQTNEVRRSIALLGGFLEIAKATGLPLRCFEIAASAGLNLSWDRYRYRMGDVTWGDPAAAVRIDTAWEGGSPPVEARVSVIERAACDRRPIDLHDPDERRRLVSYIWADQTERLVRINAAIDVALANKVHVERADAIDWVRAKVAPKPGTASVLYHSVFWQYMPAESREALAALIAEIGAQATPDAPVAWLRMEPRGAAPLMDVTLTLWPGGEDRLLANAGAHAAEVRWFGANHS